MNIDLASRKRNNAKQDIVDLFSHATHFGLSYDKILESRNVIYERELTKTPRWVRSYIQGVWDTLTTELYRDHLVYGGKVDETFYSTHDNRDDYYEKNGISPRDFADDGRVKDRGHYWRNSLKPFCLDNNG